MTWLQIVLLALATYRASMLVTRDQFPFGPLRRAVDRNWTGSLVELLHCNWCVSLWIGAGFLCLTLYYWYPWEYFEVVFTASAVAGFLADRS